MEEAVGGQEAPQAGAACKVVEEGAMQVVSREAFPGLAAQALARSLTDGRHTAGVAQTLAEILPSATAIRIGFRTTGGVLLLSSCLLTQGGSPARFFVVPSCPSALQECLDSGLCGFYLRSDAHMPDLHVLWRDAPHTMAALCAAVPSTCNLPDSCAGAILVGIRRGDNSLVSADLSNLALALAQHIPALAARVSKGEEAFLPIPDPSSALQGLQPSSLDSHTPTSSSCLSSDNSSSWGVMQGMPLSGSGSGRSGHRSGSRGSGSLGRQLPVCPEGVSIQEDREVWEADETSAPRQRFSPRSSGSLGRQLPMWPEGVSIQGDSEVWEADGETTISVVDTSADHGSADTLHSGTHTAGSSAHSRGDTPASGGEAPCSPAQDVEQPSKLDTETDRHMQPGESSSTTAQHWDDDEAAGSARIMPAEGQRKPLGPAGFALFDSASSDPGTYSGTGTKKNDSKAQQGTEMAQNSSSSDQDSSTQSVETALMPPDSDSSLVISTPGAKASLTLPTEEAVVSNEDCDTAEESEEDAPGAMPPKSGAQARRARAARAQARARRQRAAQALQQPESSSTSYRQWASLEGRQGGNGSDSDSPPGGNGTPYRRRSPQHPFWLYFLDPALEANFVAWQAQQQYKGDILSAALVVFVLTIELAHPSLEGFAFNLQACISATAAGALYVVLMHKERWQRARERLVSWLHCLLSGLILAFVFPAWARSLPAPKVASPMWLFRFSGAEGCCALPFIFMLRFRRAFWNQAFMLAAAAAASLPTACLVPGALSPAPLCFGLGALMEAGALVVPLAVVRALEQRARGAFLHSPAALLPHAD